MNNYSEGMDPERNAMGSIAAFVCGAALGATVGAAVGAGVASDGAARARNSTSTTWTNTTGNA